MSETKTQTNIMTFTRPEIDARQHEVQQAALALYHLRKAFECDYARLDSLPNLKVVPWDTHLPLMRCMSHYDDNALVALIDNIK